MKLILDYWLLKQKTFNTTVSIFLTLVDSAPKFEESFRSENNESKSDSSDLNIPKECPNGFKRIFSNKGDRDLCHAFFLNPSLHPKTWKEV